MGQPPTFLQLLSEIRVEEEYEASRRKLSPAKSVQVKTVSIPAEVEVKDLQAEIQELKLKVTELTALPSAQSAKKPASESVSIAEVGSSEDDKHLQGLKKEVKKLRKQVSVMSVNPTTVFKRAQPSQDFPPIHRQERASAPRAYSQRDSSDFFCYRCGEDGHISNKCNAAENNQKVIQKLIRAQRQLRTNQKEKNVATTPESTHNADVKKFSMNVPSSHLPEGLIGPPSTTSVKVEGQPCTALTSNYHL